MTVEGEKKKAGLRKLLWGGRSSCPRRRIETAFLPDTSLVLEERRSDLLRRASPDLQPTRCPSAPPTVHCSSGIYSNSTTPRRIAFRPLPPLPPSRTNLNTLSEEDWTGNGKSRSSSVEQGDERRGGQGGRSSRREDPRRHTLGGPDPLASQHYQLAPRTTMDLECPISSKGYPLAPSNPLLLDDDPGIMSEVETSSTGFRRGNKQRSSLPVVRTPSKTLERPLGLVFLQYRGETKRALLPNEITSIDTVKALFVRSFSKQLTMEYMDSPHVKIYIHDSSKDMFYELEDIRSHLRDIRDRSVLRLFESSDVAGPGATWDQDQSYFSEPEFDSDYQHQHIHKTKGSKGGGYYMAHSYPPGGGVPRGVAAGPLLRNTPSAIGQTSSPYPGQAQPTADRSRGYSSGGSFEDPYYSAYPSRPGTITPVIDEEASDTEMIEDTYSTYSVRRGPFHSTPSIPPYDATRMRVEHMERQLANLTGLVHKALAVTPRQAPELVQVPPTPTTPVPPASAPAHPFRSHSDRDRHKPTPPPKPVALSPGQYESRNVYRDLQLTAEMYNQLRSLQKKAKELKCEMRTLRRLCQTQAHSLRETIRDAGLNIRAMLLAGSGEGLWGGMEGDNTRLKTAREEQLYRQQMIKLETDLTELESSVEELRGNVINRKTRVNMSDVENMALVLSKSSKTVAELKLRFPNLQDSIKTLIAQEMEKSVCEEKFLKDEPERLENALRRCKKLTGTLVTLKRLASVQEQRLPESRLSPPLVEAEEPPPTPTSTKILKNKGC